MVSRKSFIHQTASRFLPFARRRLNTSRPPLVAMRARKPWVRFRRILLGWYVRFIDLYLFNIHSMIANHRETQNPCQLKLNKNWCLQTHT